MVEGFICEYNKGQGFFCKKAKEWKGSLLKMRECRGVWEYLPFSSPSRPGNRGGRVRGGGGPCRQPWGLGGGRVGGGKEEGCTGNGFAPQFRRRGPAGRGAMAAGGGRPWPVRWWRCRAWRRPGLGGKGRGRRWDPFPPLTMDWGAAERASHGAGGGGQSLLGRRR